MFHAILDFASLPIVGPLVMIPLLLAGAAICIAILALITISTVVLIALRSVLLPKMGPKEDLLPNAMPVGGEALTNPLHGATPPAEVPRQQDVTEESQPVGPIGEDFFTIRAQK